MYRTGMLCRLLLFCCLAVPGQAALYSPRIVSPHNADTYSLKTFAEFPRWRDLSGDAKVYEIFKYLADRRTGPVSAWRAGAGRARGLVRIQRRNRSGENAQRVSDRPLRHVGTGGGGDPGRAWAIGRRARS